MAASGRRLMSASGPVGIGLVTARLCAARLPCRLLAIVVQTSLMGSRIVARLLPALLLRKVPLVIPGCVGALTSVVSHLSPNWLTDQEARAERALHLMTFGTAQRSTDFTGNFWKIQVCSSCPLLASPDRVAALLRRARGARGSVSRQITSELGTRSSAALLRFEVLRGRGELVGFAVNGVALLRGPRDGGIRVAEIRLRRS